MGRCLLTCLMCVAAVLAQSGCRDVELEEHEEDEGRASRPQNVLHVARDAQKLIRLSTDPVHIGSVPDTIETTGWFRAKPGKEVVVKALATGYYAPGSDPVILEVGSHVSDGQRIGELRIVLSSHDEAQLVIAKEEADILMNQSLVTLRLAEDQLERLRKAPDTVAGTRLIELEETVERARVAYREAQEQLPFLPEEPYGETLKLKPAAIECPMSGRIAAINVVPRQFVLQGDPLFTVADWSTLWLEIPVFVGDLPRVQQERDIQLKLPGTGGSLTARAVQAPQPTEPGRRTVGLLYEIDDSSGALRPGQPVSVDLPVGKTIDRITVPRTAIVWDGMGNAWVYVRAGPESFRRQRIEVGKDHGKDVVVERGLEENQQVVTVGAESLYGEEFKGQIQLEDDD